MTQNKNTCGKRFFKQKEFLMKKKKHFIFPYIYYIQNN